jgi:hypothetical protein
MVIVGLEFDLLNDGFDITVAIQRVVFTFQIVGEKQGD